MKTYLTFFFSNTDFLKIKFSNLLRYEMYDIEKYFHLKLGCSFPKSRKVSIFHNIFSCCVSQVISGYFCKDKEDQNKQLYLNIF